MLIRPPSGGVVRPRRVVRFARDRDADPGDRNGHQPVTVKITSGPGSGPSEGACDSQRFASQLFGADVTRTNALEALVIAGVVRGL
jgi:putative transposase